MEEGAVAFVRKIGEEPQDGALLEDKKQQGEDDGQGEDELEQGQGCVRDFKGLGRPEKGHCQEDVEEQEPRDAVQGNSVSRRDRKQLAREGLAKQVHKERSHGRELEELADQQEPGRAIFDKGLDQAEDRQEEKWDEGGHHDLEPREEVGRDGRG